MEAIRFIAAWISARLDVTLPSMLIAVLAVVVGFFHWFPNLTTSALAWVAVVCVSILAAMLLDAICWPIRVCLMRRKIRLLFVNEAALVNTMIESKEGSFVASGKTQWTALALVKMKILAHDADYKTEAQQHLFHLTPLARSALTKRRSST